MTQSYLDETWWRFAVTGASVYDIGIGATCLLADVPIPSFWGILKMTAIFAFASVLLVSTARRLWESAVCGFVGKIHWRRRVTVDLIATFSVAFLLAIPVVFVFPGLPNSFLIASVVVLMVVPTMYVIRFVRWLDDVSGSAFEWTEPLWP